MMKKNFWRVMLVIAVAAITVLFHKTGLLQKTMDWIDGCGFWGPPVFLGVYILGCIFFMPSFVLTFAGGVLFGFWKGAALSLLGGGVGALVAFSTGRYLVRDWVEKKFSNHRKFKQIAGVVQAAGWKFIVLARLSPVFPFSIGNYGFGVMRIPMRQYFVASVLGSIPSVSVYTSLGAAAGGLAALGTPGRARTAGEWFLLAVGLGATIALTWSMRKIARKELRHSLK